MNSKERKRALLGKDKPKQTAKKFTSFYENEVLEKSQEQPAEVKPELNRRTRRPKDARKSGELNRNTNYRVHWQDEE